MFILATFCILSFCTLPFIPQKKICIEFSANYPLITFRIPQNTPSYMTSKGGGMLGISITLVSSSSCQQPVFSLEITNANFWQIWKKTQINCSCTRHARAKLVLSSTSSNHRRKWYITKNYKSSSANTVIVFLSDAMLVRSQVYHTERPPGE